MREEARGRLRMLLPEARSCACPRPRSARNEAVHLDSPSPASAFRLTTLGGLTGSRRLIYRALCGWAPVGLSSSGRRERIWRCGGGAGVSAAR